MVYNITILLGSMVGVGEILAGAIVVNGDV